MTAGPELNAFQSNLATTTSQLEIVRQDVEALGFALDSAALASESYLRFRETIKTLDASFSATLTMLKLTENVAPLKPSSVALKEVLEVLQPRIADLKDATDRAQRIEPMLELIDDASDVFNNTVRPAINSADATLDNVSDGINEIVDAFDRVSTPNGIPALNPNAGTQRPGAADFSVLFARTDNYVAFANGATGAAQGVFDAYDGSKALLNEVADLFDIVDFPDLNEILGKLNEFSELFDGLAVILDIVEGALRPIQPLLDAVGAVFDTFVTPVVDYLIETIGVNDLFDALAEQLDPLFPDIDLFDDFLNVAERLEGMLEQIDFDQFDIPDFTAEALDVFDRFTDEIAATLNGIPLRIGDADDQTMIGTGGDEAFDPRGGDDEVQANAGNNIIVASAGDDTITGGSGVDRLVFAGELVEYEFTRNDDTGELIFTHTVLGSHGFNEGTEIVTDVEYFDFGTETFTKEQFETAITGMSVLEGTDEGELIFLNPNGTLIDGLTLNGKTFDGMNVVYGLGGDDRIQGTLEDDFIFGGAGNDLLVPRGGDDALDGGPGIDTFQIFDPGFGPIDRIDLAAGTSFVTGRDTAELANVENVIVQHQGSIVLSGSDQGNVLFTGRGGDLISGRAGNDALFGNAGRDVLFGGIGVDTLRGGDQGDYLGALNTSDNGPAELYDGEAGIDTLSYSTSESAANQFLDDDLEFTGDLRAAMTDAAPTGPVVVRAALGEVDRLNASGGVIATDIALNIETFLGSDSDDVLYGGGDILNQISINGSGGNDVLYSWGSQGVGGGGGDDLLIAERGPDGGRVAGGFNGGGGFDTLDLQRLGDVRFIIEGNGDDSGLVIVRDKGFAGGVENSRSDSFSTSDIDVYLLSDNDDVVEWDAKTSPTFRGGGGNDYMSSLPEMGNTFKSPEFYGEEGDDTIVLVDGGSAFGGTGNDRIEVAAFGEMFAQGDAGNDIFVISQMTGILTGGAGFDTLIIDQPGTDGVAIDLPAGTVTADSPNVVGSDKIRLTGVTGIEAVITTDERDTVTGSDGSDRIVLRGGRDVADGGDGNDQMFGGSANDSLNGGAGDDTISGGTGNDTINGGAGIDAVDYAFASPDGDEGELIGTRFIGATVDLSQSIGGRGDEVDTISFVENVFGTLLDDRLSGDAQDNVLSGGAGADTLEGRGGEDVLIAGGGGTSNTVDILNGGAGDDQLLISAGAFVADGGVGSDTIDFSGGSDAADGGGRTVSLVADLQSGSVTREVETSIIVWAEDGGGQSARSFDGQRIAPEDVLRSDPYYARSTDDLTLRLPTGEEDGDVPSFAIEVATSVISRQTEIGVISNIENVVGTAEQDVLSGNEANNSLSGGTGDDLLSGRQGNDILLGGEGRDTAFFEGNQAQYTLTLSQTSTTVADRQSGGSGTDTLVDIEFLDFANKLPVLSGNPFDLEVFGSQLSIGGADLESIIELYIAYFNRAPDAIGLGFWASGFTKGLTLEKMAFQFVDQDETRAKYPEETTNGEFATSVYNNVLGRAPDDSGLNFWVGHLDSGSLSRDGFILEFLGGARSELKTELGQAFVDQQLADRAYLDDQIDIGAYFAVHKGMTNVDNASTAMALFDGSQSSLDSAVAAIEGYYQDALDPNNGEFLMQVVGVLDDPFAMI